VDGYIRKLHTEGFNLYSSVTSTNSPVILHESLERESHKTYDPPIPVTCLQRLRKQTNFNTFRDQIAETLI